MQNRKRTAGFLLPFAAVLLLGISALAVAINQIASQSKHASVVEGISIQAFYAAESGAYFGLNRVMFDVSENTVADANCTAVSGSTINFNANGLQSCSALVTCTVTTVLDSAKHFYEIRSDASCGSGDIFSQRIVEVSASL